MINETHDSAHRSWVASAEGFYCLSRLGPSQSWHLGRDHPTPVTDLNRKNQRAFVVDVNQKFCRSQILSQSGRSGKFTPLRSTANDFGQPEIWPAPFRSATGRRMPMVRFAFARYRRPAGANAVLARGG